MKGIDDDTDGLALHEYLTGELSVLPEKSLATSSQVNCSNGTWLVVSYNASAL